MPEETYTTRVLGGSGGEDETEQEKNSGAGISTRAPLGASNGGRLQYGKVCSGRNATMLGRGKV